jgi:hypothetical protein
MITTFERKEVIRLRREFLRFTDGSEFLSRKNFLLIPCIAVNPLQDRICLCFGFHEIENDDTETEGKSSKSNITAKATEELNLNNNNPKIDTEKRLSVTSVVTGETKMTPRLSLSNQIEGLIPNETPQTPTTILPEGVESSPSTALNPLIPIGDGEREKLENVIDIEAPPETINQLELELVKLVTQSKTDEDNSKNIDFRTFLKNVSAFNCFGRIEEKLKLAFRIQDFDNDDIISRSGMSIIDKD